MNYAVILSLLSIISFVTADFVVEQIQKFGYPIEVHHTFSDSFKLRLHRIPRGISTNSTTTKPTSVLLVHGIIESASIWIYNEPPAKALAFMLAENGFDVWLFNARGTTYSRYNKRWDQNNAKYWDFSWHEIGVRDLPVTIDYIREHNGNQSIHYVGHSQGGTSILVLLSTLPAYNKKLKSMYLIAPAVFLQNSTTLLKALVPNIKNIVNVLEQWNVYGIVPDTLIANQLMESACRGGACTEIFYMVIGNDTGQMNKKTIFDDFRKLILNRCSVKQLVHFAQSIQSGKFRMFDYGLANRKIYGATSPPRYNLSAVTVPATVFYGTVDALVTPDGVEMLGKLLPNVKNTFEVPWNHMDVVLGSDSNVEIFDRIVGSMVADETAKEENLKTKTKI